jgi:hypothetical protein
MVQSVAEVSCWSVPEMRWNLSEVRERRARSETRRVVTAVAGRVALLRLWVHHYGCKRLADGITTEQQRLYEPVSTQTGLLRLFPVF